MPTLNFIVYTVINISNLPLACHSLGLVGFHGLFMTFSGLQFSCNIFRLRFTSFYRLRFLLSQFFRFFDVLKNYLNPTKRMQGVCCLDFIVISSLCAKTTHLELLCTVQALISLLNYKYSCNVVSRGENSLLS